jgi:hypothetical protein
MPYLRHCFVCSCSIYSIVGLFLFYWRHCFVCSCSIYGLVLSVLVLFTALFGLFLLMDKRQMTRYGGGMNSDIPVPLMIPATKLSCITGVKLMIVAESYIISLISSYVMACRFCFPNLRLLILQLQAQAHKIWNTFENVHSFFIL